MKKSGNLPRQLKGANETYVEVGFANLMQFIYGYRRCEVKAGWSKVAHFKRGVIKLFRTVAAAAERNVHGDDAHREEIADRCNVAVNSLRRSNTIDAVTQHAVQGAFEVIFLLLGRLPRNWQKPVAGFRSTVELAKFRTFTYVRTDTQRVDEMVDYAYRQKQGREAELFDRVIAVRLRHPRNDRKVLDWIRANEPELYRRFNRV
jgi:hypothetical protein